MNGQEQARLSPSNTITVIGPAIVDVLAGPVDEQIFQTTSQPMKNIQLSFGGDALNEAVALSRFGRNVGLISKVGQDEAGEQVLAYLRKNGVQTDCVQMEEGLATGMNIVLVDRQGERHFLTNPNGSLRKLTEGDILPYLDAAADIVSFASLFVSPPLDIPAMERLFQKIKAKPGRFLAADMTNAKCGEHLSDIAGLLRYIDCLFPNEGEIAQLTGCKDPYVNAYLLVEKGVGCAVVKLGCKGCLIRTKSELLEIPAYPVKNAVDTTGAGDCFAAGFLWALSEGWPLADCGYFACAAASCAVEEVGATAGLHSLNVPMQRFHELKQIKK